MRLMSAYCPVCDANRQLTVTPSTTPCTTTDDLPGHWWPAVVLACPAGHPIARLGVIKGTDRALETLLPEMDPP